MRGNESQGSASADRALVPFLPSPLFPGHLEYFTWQNPPGTQITELGEKVNKAAGSPI